MPTASTKRNITDRALRYRANATPPAGPRQCCLCGSRKNVEVGHINGREEDSEPENLFWTCRSCNVQCGQTLKRANLGRLTRQYNGTLSNPGGAKSMGQWVAAVMSMKGQSDQMSVADAVAMIRATSQAKRAQYASEIYSLRRSRGNPAKHWLEVLPVVRRTNPGQATGLFEAFHGRPADSVTVDKKKIHYPANIELLGGLIELELEDGELLEFDPAETTLWSNKKGTQYYIRGEQEIDVSEFGSDPQKDEVDLGLVYSVTYYTDKQHLNDSDREAGAYEHEFGEEGGTPPTLVYDNLNHELKFVGGTYHIDWDMDSGRHSAGIRD